MTDITDFEFSSLRIMTVESKKNDGKPTLYCLCLHHIEGISSVVAVESLSYAHTTVFSIEVN